MCRRPAGTCRHQVVIDVAHKGVGSLRASAVAAEPANLGTTCSSTCPASWLRGPSLLTAYRRAWQPARAAGKVGRRCGVAELWQWCGGWMARNTMALQVRVARTGEAPFLPCTIQMLQCLAGTPNGDCHRPPSRPQLRVICGPHTHLPLPNYPEFFHCCGPAAPISMDGETEASHAAPWPAETGK